MIVDDHADELALIWGDDPAEPDPTDSAPRWMWAVALISAIAVSVLWEYAVASGL